MNASHFTNILTPAFDGSLQEESVSINVLGMHVQMDGFRKASGKQPPPWYVNFSTDSSIIPDAWNPADGLKIGLND